MTQMPHFSLRDQHEKLFTPRQLEGCVAVLIASNINWLGQSRQWGKILKDKYQDNVNIIGVADIRGVPSVMKSMAAHFFKSDEISILLDWEGDIFDACSLTKDSVNIVVIDKTGLIYYVFAGEVSEKAIGSVVGKVDALITY